MFLKIIILLAYFLLVFIGARLFEFYVTSVAGWKSFNDVIPDLFNNFQSRKPQESDQEAYNHERDGNYNYSDENNESEIDPQNGQDDENLQILNFSSYGEFQENVEDTKACIWVVQVANKRKHILDKKEWKWISQRLRQFGIKLGTYKCSIDRRLCMQRDIYSSTVILAMPKTSQPKGNVDFHIFQKENNNKELKKVIFDWIKTKLYPKVKTVHSLVELTERPMPRYRYKHSKSPKPSMYFIYQSNERVPPLLFTSLSVKFTGRIKFYMFKTTDVSKMGNVFAMSPTNMYNYGKNQGEYFTYSCVEFFLRTLHPEVNDIFVISVVLINMACWLELFLQKGGPLKRLFYYFWGFAMANFVLVSIWLMIIQLLYMPQIQPIIELCLKNFQQVMFTNIAAIIRKDIIQLSKHLYGVIFGFVGYGILIGYLRYRMRRNRTDNLTFSVMELIRYDVEELSELFYSLIAFITPSLRIYRFEESIERILNRLSTPDLWLHSKNPTDYIRDLPTWTYYCNEPDCPENGENVSDEELLSDGEGSSPILYNSKVEDNETVDNPPNQLLEDCVICLDVYKCLDVLRGLPCGHCFHKACIDSWLLPHNELSQHRCPVCRWPADIKKGKVEVIDLT